MRVLVCVREKEPKWGVGEKEQEREGTGERERQSE